MELNARIISVTDTGTQRIVACETGGHFRVLRADGNTDSRLLSMLSEQRKEAAITVEGDMIVHVRPLNAVKESGNRAEDDAPRDKITEDTAPPCLRSVKDVEELFRGFLQKRGGPENDLLDVLLQETERPGQECCDTDMLRACVSAYCAGLARFRDGSLSIGLTTDGQKAAFGAYMIAAERGYSPMLQGRIYGMLDTVSSVGTDLAPTPEALCLKEMTEKAKGGLEDV